MLPVLILAGGLATRMRPLTEKIPKSLIEVNGRPFVLHQLDYLRSQGVRRVILSVGYLGNQIESLIGDGNKYGLDVQYSYDGPVLLGTGGAVKKALPFLGDRFFVLYGDSYLPVDFRDVVRSFDLSGKPALMTILKNNNQWDASNVIYENDVLVEYNKKERSDRMNYIDYGLAVLTNRVFSSCSSEFGSSFDLADLYHELSIVGQLEGFEVFERFYEVGSISGLREIEEYFLTYVGDGL